MSEEKLIIGKDLYYPGILEMVRKAPEPFRPIFEAFTNSLESIRLRFGKRQTDGHIKIILFFHKGLLPDDYIFDKFTIEDNGIGFDDDNFDRITRYKDTRKGFANKGTGRIQLLHFFDLSEYESIYSDNGSFMRRHFSLSKQYLKENAIISYQEAAPSNVQNIQTTLTLSNISDKRDSAFYNKATATSLKQELISRYMVYFCVNRDSLPKIDIIDYTDNKLCNNVSIVAHDIPPIDKSTTKDIHYFLVDNNGKSFERQASKEAFEIFAFKIDKSLIDKNAIKLTSKGEIVAGTRIELDTILPEDAIDNCRYLFLISSPFLDNRDSDTRGSLNIRTREDAKKANLQSQYLFNEPEIFIDDIHSEINAALLDLYPSIRQKLQENKVRINKLADNFLLDKNTVNSMTFKIGESEERILEKVYSVDAKITAKRDAEIERCIAKLDELDTTSDDSTEKLDCIIDELVKTIPMQNRMALTHYVARRKLVLRLFKKILERELIVQKVGKRNIDEKLLHNLIFQQSSNNPEESDLWLINEDFIYFKGSSEIRLCAIEIDGQKIFKEEISAEEEKILLSLGEDRSKLQPDILLFPDEGKCIIIEFKNINVNVSDHLNQINNYASLIKRFSNEQFNIETFYGYLIGESINTDDVRSFDADFLPAYNFDYVFRPNKKIYGGEGGRDGALYTEVIKYSTLLERATRRNEIFIKKLMESKNENLGLAMPDTNVTVYSESVVV
jgi:hypothetical protein